MSTPPGPWQVRIKGSPLDLEHLARHFTTAPTRVVKRDKEFLFESAAFAACVNAEEVLRAAEEELRVLSGVLRLARGSREALRADFAVYRVNAAGGRDVFIQVHDTVSIQIEAGDAIVTVTDAQGNVIPQRPPPPRTIALSRFAATDATAAKALRLFAGEDARTWTGLYRIHEVVEGDVGGERALQNRGWGSGNAIKRFKQSANSVSVAGDSARHGDNVHAAPKQPMSLEEADSYVTYVVSAWLASKGV